MNAPNIITGPSDLKVCSMLIEGLRPYAKNSRKHSNAQIRQIAESIQAFGFNAPLLVDNQNGVIAGHGRLEAAKLLGLKEVPTICLGYLSEAKKKAYIIADNRLAERSTWDTGMLASEIQSIMTEIPDLIPDAIGFDHAAIDLMLLDAENQDPDQGDDLPPLPAEAVCKPDDLWTLGNHRLFCGNSLKEESYTAVLAGAKAQLIFTDPPYNVPIAGHVSGLGENKHQDFAMGCGEMSPVQFTAFLEEACKLMTQHSEDGSLHYIFMGWQAVDQLLAAGRKTYAELKNICVWVKDNGGMGSLYRSRHELVCLFKNGAAKHINNVQLGKHGRNRTNVWNYRGVNTFRKGRGVELAMHPTVKPVAMVADALMDASLRECIVLDPFAGSGSVAIAAEKTHRHARLIEMDPRYCDVIIRRWQEFTGQKAVHAFTGLTFDATSTEEAGHE